MKVALIILLLVGSGCCSRPIDRTKVITIPNTVEIPKATLE